MAYTQVTLADLQTQLGYRTESNPWWTPAQATAALNEALRIWNAATGRWTTTILVPVIPNDPFVPVASALTQASRVLWNAIPLDKCSMADLDYGIPNWRNATTTTAGHPTRPSYWAPVALNLLVVYPAADLALFPSTLDVAGVRRTPLLVNPGDFVDLGQEELDILLGYALHALSFTVGMGRLTETRPGYLAFLSAAAKENQQFAASTFYRRALGLDLQRVLRTQTRPVENPVDSVLDQASQQGGG
jgi:hypothetical protein